MITLISFLFTLGIIVLIHELGHFAVAKAAGIKVKEFSAGMGPMIIGRTYGETLYSLRAIPIGGFVNLVGMTDDGEEDEGEDEETIKTRGFAGKPISWRIAVLAAGALMNFLLSFLIFWGLFYFAGVPEKVTFQITKVMKNGVAEKIGLKDEDIILEVEQIKITNVKLAEAAINTIKKSSGKQLRILIQRDKKKIEFFLTPEYNKDRKSGQISVHLRHYILNFKKLGLFPAFKESFIRLKNLSFTILNGFKQLISRKIKMKDIAGPVGIARITGQAAKKGIVRLLELIALLSLNIGILNLLPFPALDGGRLIFQFIELFMFVITRKEKKISPKIEEAIHTAGLLFLLGLIVIITYNDIKNMFF